MKAATLILVAGLIFPAARSQADEPSPVWQFTGVTQAAATAVVRARVTGYLTQVSAKLGAPVKKGALLVEIDGRPYQLELDAAQARVRVAEAKRDAAKIIGANAEKLLRNKVISPQELALKKAAEAEAEAALDVAKSELEQAKLSLSWTQVVSPIEGTVSRLQVAEGDLVIADQTQIMTIVNNNQLRVAFNVSETIVLRLRRGSLADANKLSVAIGCAGEEGFPHAAKLDFIAQEVDSRTGAARFSAALPNPKGFLLPGMSVRVRVTTRPK